METIRVLLIACSCFCAVSCSPQEELLSANTGSAVAQALWPRTGKALSRQNALRRTAPSGVMTVRFLVFGPDLATPLQQDFDVSLGSGTISGIPVGANRSLVLQGLDGNKNRLYEGAALNISIASGQITDCGVVQMYDAVDGAPTNISPQNGSAFTAGTDLVFSWTPVAGADSYNVDIYEVINSITTGIYVQQVGGPAGTLHTVSAATFTAGHTYYWMVNTDDAQSGYGPWSNPWSFTIAASSTDNTWQAAGAMNTARMADFALLLPTGKVLVAGGADTLDPSGYANEVYATAELFDPSTSSFSSTGSMNTKRAWHFSDKNAAAALLNNGKVLITGGYDGNITAYSSAELYDPRTGVFTNTSGTLPFSSFHHAATLLRSGKVLVGPTYSCQAAEYDPATDTFTPVGNSIYPRTFHTQTLLPNGKVLIAGGTTGEETATAEIYDPYTQTFSLTGSMHSKRERHRALLLADGTVLITGGELYSASTGSAEVLDSAEQFDYSTHTFTEIETMNRERSFHAMNLLWNGMALIDGYYAEAELFDPVTNAFTLTDSSAFARSWHHATMLADGSVLVTSGGQRAAERYVPTAPLDSTPPANAALLINAGAATTNSQTVQLTLSASDDTGVTGYYVSESFETPLAALSSWLPLGENQNYYNESEPFLLSSGSGPKTIYLWFKDAAGNVSSSISATITLD